MMLPALPLRLHALSLLPALPLRPLAPPLLPALPLCPHTLRRCCPHGGRRSATSPRRPRSRSKPQRRPLRGYVGVPSRLLPLTAPSAAQMSTATGFLAMSPADLTCSEYSRVRKLETCIQSNHLSKL